jgi:NADH-quinone oxidoreductase subunit J
MHLILFYLFSAVAVLSGICVIAARRPTRALLSLILTMFALAGIYLLLGAPFVAMTHLIVYAGAVLILFLFVIMLQGVAAQEDPLFKRFGVAQVLMSIAAGIAFLILLLMSASSLKLPDAAGTLGTIEVVGQTLLTNYLLPFELTSFLLLIGVFAAVSLAKKDEP